MIPIVTPEEMAAIDAAAPEPVDVLVGRAGAAVARAARRMLGGTYGRVVNVIAGKGNNGADGRVAGELLASAGVSRSRVRSGGEPGVTAVRRPGRRCRLRHRVPRRVDGAGGWRCPRSWRSTSRAASTGSPASPCRERSLRAETVTFAAMKPGLLVNDGKRLAGRVTVADIGLDVSSARAHAVEGADVAAWWRPRPPDAHKWTQAVRVVAGSPGMTGAASLASVAAMRAGAGIVWLSTPGEAAPRAELIEVVGKPCPAVGWGADVTASLGRFGALVIGPGLGLDTATVGEVRAVVAAASCPTVVDGDGLTALATSPGGAAVGAASEDGADGADPARRRVRAPRRRRRRVPIASTLLVASRPRPGRSSCSRVRRR